MLAAVHDERTREERFLAGLRGQGRRKPAPGRQTVQVFGQTCVVRSYWSTVGFRCATKVKTPGGSKVAYVTPCVDVYYTMRGDRPRIRKVTLARRGGSVMGSTRAVNVLADNTGEVWFARGGFSGRDLRRAVEADLEQPKSTLRKEMAKHWCRPSGRLSNAWATSLLFAGAVVLSVATFGTSATALLSPCAVIALIPALFILAQGGRGAKRILLALGLLAVGWWIAVKQGAGA